MTAPTGARTQTSVRVLGGKKTNLVSIRDSGKEKVEFRIQLEIQLDEATARQIESVVMRGGKSDENAVRRAAESVLANVPDDATTEFRKIIEIGFLDQLNPDPE